MEHVSQDETVLAVLKRLGLIGMEDVRTTPLSGGVSSDIQLVETAARRFCVKRALPRLKVAALWEAPVTRNAAEAAWMSTVAAWFPKCVPTLFGENKEAGLFVMEYLEPATHPVWKSLLRDGVIDHQFAVDVGARLADIHRRSAGDCVLAQGFANDETFEAIRLEPYLRATAKRHSDLSDQLNALADQTLANKRALVHGDFSPKNILRGPSGPVFLDAECAWYGDPAFDLAFCLNHLLLKGAWQPQWRRRYIDLFGTLAATYLARVDWEAPGELESRSAALLPGLLLARIDGKSPVEYLPSEDSRKAVRLVARELLMHPTECLRTIGQIWEKQP
jgi:aminoglycoside phosphotransferase (APT) family kinase protein